MKKKITVFVCLLVLICSMVSPVFASSALPRVVDGADLLTSDEEAALEQKIAEVAGEYNFDIVVVTAQNLEGKTATAFADDYFDYNGYGYGSNYDGILFAIGMEEREWAISTCGYGLVAFTDYSTDLMGENIIPYLSDGDYYKAFETFVEMSEDTLWQAAYDDPYDVDNQNPSYDDSSVGSLASGLVMLLPALLIGFVISILIALGFKAQLKTARPESYAGSYTRRGSFNLRQSNDIYLFSRTSRVRIDNDSSSRSGGGTSSHRSSSGRSHGGSSGRF